MLSPLAAELSRSRRLILVDLPGHGRSPVLDRAFMVEQVADEVAGVISRLEQSCPVVSPSFGGAVALALAARHPGLVARLVLACTAVRFDEARDFWRARAASVRQTACARSLGRASAGGSQTRLRPTSRTWCSGCTSSWPARTLSDTPRDASACCARRPRTGRSCRPAHARHGRGERRRDASVAGPKALRGESVARTSLYCPVLHISATWRPPITSRVHWRSS